MIIHCPQVEICPVHSLDAVQENMHHRFVGSTGQLEPFEVLKCNPFGARADFCQHIVAYASATEATFVDIMIMYSSTASASFLKHQNISNMKEITTILRHQLSKNVYCTRLILAWN